MIEQPTPFLSKQGNKIHFALVLLMYLIGFYAILVISPIEPDQQMAQKIFYLHVPAAWTSFLAYFMVMIYSIQFLRTKNVKWDNYAFATAEVGTLFCAFVLISGPIWAAPIWGKAWSWEPRLTTTLIMFLVYLGYFMLRQYGGSYERVSRLSAAVGIIAFLDVPLVYYSVKLWSPEVQSHPQPGMFQQPWDILGTFLFLMITFIITFIFMVKYRLHVLDLNGYLKKGIK